jgi:hypothetical protein
MTNTKEEIEAARIVLKTEIELLKKKVESGAVLRVGERRYLLSIVDPADLKREGIKGCLWLIDYMNGEMCARCQKKLSKQRQELAAEMAEL